MSCSLCDLEPKTEQIHKDHVCSVVICETCGVPMVVYRKHKQKAPKEHLNLMENALERYAKEFYGKKKFRIDKKQRSIKDHLHWHARSA